MRVIVGSTNPVKVKAVDAVFQQFFPTYTLLVEGRAVSSDVTAQPIGFEEILQGARNRVKNAQISFEKEKNPKNQDKPDYFVGVEAGFASIAPDLYLDYQICVIQDSRGREGIGSGPGLSFPASIIQELLTHKTVELGDIMGRLSGNATIKYEEGGVGYYSQSRIIRFDLTTLSVEMALIPFLNPQSYFPK